jgi:hypothetical protein
MVNFRTNQIVGSLCLLLPLNGCGVAGPRCESSDTQNFVIKIVAGDRNNALVDYATKESNAVEVRLGAASTDAEKSLILEKARRNASYKLTDTISENPEGKDKRAVTCTGVLSTTVEDTTAQKVVNFKVEQAPDGNISVSVSPFQFERHPS